MGSPLRVAALVVAAAAVLWAARSGPAPAGPAQSAADRAGTFTFEAGAEPADRQAFLDAVASARPEARALIARVDGLVRVRIGATGQDAIGLAAGNASGWTVTVDLGPVAARNGRRGIDRVVLHELGHVVDHTLVEPALAARLDAGIPAGWGCDQGSSGACANRSERFAESFAKWATGDIGVDLFIGYRVPPPGPSLDAWGAPLAALAAVD
jgi:hypothetical protein